MITATQRASNEAHIARRTRMFHAAVKFKTGKIAQEAAIAERPTLETMAVSYDRPPRIYPFAYTEERPQPPIDFIIKQVCAHYAIPKNAVLSIRRTAPVVLARHVGFWMAKGLTLQSLPEIGRRFGGKDHTTVLHGVRRIDRLRSRSPEFTAETDALKTSIQAAWKATAL